MLTSHESLFISQNKKHLNPDAFYFLESLISFLNINQSNLSKYKCILYLCISLLYFYKKQVYNLIQEVMVMKKDFGDSISNKVYEYRVLARMSQQELAEKVGVSKQTIFVMEKGNYVPTLLLAFRIAEFFNVDVNDIFTYLKGNDKNGN